MAWAKEICEREMLILGVEEQSSSSAQEKS